MLAQRYRLRRNAEVMMVLKRGTYHSVHPKVVSLKYNLGKVKSKSEKVKTKESATHFNKNTEYRRKKTEELTGNWKLETGNSRFAVVCSTKVFKRAVDRNRAKRLVRESVRLLLKDPAPDGAGHGKIKAGYDLVFLVQSGIRGKKMQKVKEEIEGLLRKAGLFVENSKFEVRNTKQ
jgi:ribonuclease P protein component